MASTWRLSLVRPLCHGHRQLRAFQSRHQRTWSHGDLVLNVQQRAGFSDHVKGKTSDGHTYKIQLDSRKIVGVYQSRGSREYQEDRTAIHTLHLPPSELLASLPEASSGSSSTSSPSRPHSHSHRSARHRPSHIPSTPPNPPAPPASPSSPSEAGQHADPGPAKEATAEEKTIQWDPDKAGGEDLAGQVSYFGIFDGHGGQIVSSYLHGNLHAGIENTDSSIRNVTQVVDYTRGLGGYFRRFRGGALSGLVDLDTRKKTGDGVISGDSESQSGTGGAGASGAEEGDNMSAAHDLRADEQRPMTLEERLTLAYLQSDKEICSRDDTLRCGSTASIALLHSLDQPAVPYFYASKLSVTIAHCGDTRILMCVKKDGKVEPLTEKHHAESRVEAARLRRLGHNLITDSFGETRWMGAIENTRSLGDKAFKPAGVTAEPEVKQRIIAGDDYCYLVFVTDGISALMSDQEIVDLARDSHDPYRAAKTIVNFAEDLGAEDNCTCIVVPLAGWGNVGGLDGTAERREYRKQKFAQLSTRMARM